MTRQIIVSDEADDDEQGLMTQLECTFRFSVRSELREAGSGDLWSFDLPLAEFFKQALALPGFRAVQALAPAPVALVLRHEEV